MAKRKRLSEELVTKWLSYFRPPAEPRTSPELPRRAPFPPAAPPIETTTRPAPPLPPEPPPGQRPRRLLIRGSEIFEIAEDGSVWPAGEDSDRVPNLGRDWNRLLRERMERELNFS